MTSTTEVATAEERRARRKTARREAILAAARRVFAEKGFEGTTIADVARKAGVASGTVYLYFDSKLQIFAALSAVLFEAIDDATVIPDPPTDLRPAVEVRVQSVFRAVGKHRDLLRLIFLNPDLRTELADHMSSTGEERLQPLEQILRNAMEGGIVREGDPKMLARLVIGMATVALYQCYIQAKAEGAAAYERTLTEMIIGGLTPHPQP